MGESEGIESVGVIATPDPIGSGSKEAFHSYNNSFVLLSETVRTNYNLIFIKSNSRSADNT